MKLEIQSIEKYLAKTLKNIDSQLGFHICGSFRRKAKDSGDIDVENLVSVIDTCLEESSKQALYFVGFFVPVLFSLDVIFVAYVGCSTY